jgi:hypothetical protein
MDDMQQEPQGSWLEKNKTVFIFLGVFFILAVVIILIFLAIRILNAPKNNPMPKENIPQATSTVENTAPILPSSGGTNSGVAAASSTATELAAEKINFGDHYQPAKEDFKATTANFILPFNVKTDVINYYDVNRKINLDAGLAGLNNDGFAILNNPFPTEANNFYNTYDLLDSKSVPTIITGDFLIYYYQNSLKLAYKNIESSIFYDNLWEVSKGLYRTANERYQVDLAQKGVVDDIALEGARLEVAYFATALSLLAPTDDQLSREGGLSETAGFNPAEAEQFSFQLPAYLTNDVGAELKLIRAGKETAKSPVLLYNRDYRNFIVPDAYKNNARLHNFYLASRWLNSVFPLNYKDKFCSDCLLDQDDWRINMLAAFLISGDLAADQDLKNRWAKIYKIQSFFSGLRGDLSYLDYQNILAENFAGKKINEVLNGTQDEIDKILAKLQKEILQMNFVPIEGGLDKTATATKPMLGLKMLVDSYSPDNYIFSELTYPKVGIFSGSLGGEKNAVSCQLPDLEGVYRCSGLADDVMNLIHSLNRKSDSYFANNTLYAGYDAQAEKLRRQLADFSVNSWHNNNYWVNLDIAEKFLSAPAKEKLPLMNSTAWQKKDLQMAITAWANGGLSADIFAPHDDQAASRLNQTSAESPYSSYKYIEPNLALSRELVANAAMINEVLSLLGSSDGQNTVSDDLKNLQKNLQSAEVIIKKELQAEDLSDDDYIFINNFTRQFSVKETGNKILTLPSSHGIKIMENLTGVKYLVFVRQAGDKKLLVVGPIFNYEEGRK